MTTVAAIDIGTNSTNLLIRDDVGRYDRITTVTRLGQGVGRTGALDPAAIERTLDALRNYRRLLERETIRELSVVGTSASRDASNRDEFFDAAQAVLGVRPRLLTGEDEGRVAYAGAVSGLGPFEGLHLVFDIGGGSTEFMVADHEGLRSVISVDVGALRLRESELQHDPPRPEELTNAIGIVQDELDDAIRVNPEILEADTIIGLGGTVSTVARVELGRADADLHGLTLSRVAIEEVFRTLATESLADRIHNPGLTDDRADIIVGGCCVLVAILRRLRADSMIVSKRGVLDRPDLAGTRGAMTTPRSGLPVTPQPDRPAAGALRLYGKRIVLRPLGPPDFSAWSGVRLRNEGWLLKWEPKRLPIVPDPARDRNAFSARCHARDRERLHGQSYAFGLLVDGAVVGEVNLNNVNRGPLQSATIGYWIDEEQAGRSLVPEGVVVAARYAFEELRLHRLEICIVPRNAPSRRVMDKLQIREEGTAVRFLEINGTWEDHVRYGITAEEWDERRDELMSAWIL